MTTLRPLVRMRHEDNRIADVSPRRAFQLQSQGWRRIGGAEIPDTDPAQVPATTPNEPDAGQPTDSGPPDTEQRADTSTKPSTKRS